MKFMVQRENKFQWHEVSLLKKLKWLLLYKANLTFRGPCIVIHSYNKSQKDALFINLILLNNSTCFGQTYCPSSGVLLLYSQQMVFVMPKFWKWLKLLVHIFTCTLSLNC